MFASQDMTFEPHWKPLENHIKDECSQFMFMWSNRLPDGTVVHSYKHIETRRYIHLSDDGKIWEYLNQKYKEVR